MDTDDNIIRAETWPHRGRSQGSFEEAYAPAPDDAGHAGETIRPAPISAAQTLGDDAERGGGAFTEGPEYRGSFGRTLFDERASEDG
jgi:hypothetical protein